VLNNKFETTGYLVKYMAPSVGHVQDVVT
jgi:hypothetical protein